MKKILLYNWVQFDDEIGRGGGVTKYLGDILSRLYTDDSVQYYFLSSGQVHTFDRKLRIEETKNSFSPYVKSFQVVNSPIMSPACLAFDSIGQYLHDETLAELIYQFCLTQGHFDAIHFHNLEGLSLSTLKLKEKLPKTKFIYSIHNYYFACPQVNLWNGKEQNCYKNCEFPHCANCRPRSSAKADQLISGLKKFLSLDDGIRKMWWYKYLICAGNILRKALSSYSGDAGQETQYIEFRRGNCSCINRYFDFVFAVSKRTAEIAIALGIDRTLVQVQYIGTVAAENQIIRQYKHQDQLTIEYLGYARKDKGFDALFELIRELCKLPEARKIRFIIAAKSETEKDYNKYRAELDEMSKYFASIEYTNGYNKSEQSKLLQSIDCGIVPACWEDNLPQVAIELIAAGVPILVSQFGGAKELLTDSWYVFDDIDDCCRKIITLANKPELLNSFFDRIPELKRLNVHVNELRSFYEVL